MKSGVILKVDVKAALNVKHCLKRNSISKKITWSFKRCFYHHDNILYFDSVVLSCCALLPRDYHWFECLCFPWTSCSFTQFTPGSCLIWLERSSWGLGVLLKGNSMFLPFWLSLTQFKKTKLSCSNTHNCVSQCKNKNAMICNTVLDMISCHYVFSTAVTKVSYSFLTLAYIMFNNSSWIGLVVCISKTRWLIHSHKYSHLYNLFLLNSIGIANYCILNLYFISLCFWLPPFLFSISIP